VCYYFDSITKKIVKVPTQYLTNDLRNIELKIKDQYEAYKTFNKEKVILYSILFMNLIFVISMNTSLPSLSYMIIFCLFIIASINDPLGYYWYDVLNKANLFVTIVFLNFHYLKNIPNMEHTNIDNVLGVAMFNNNFNCIYFGFLISSYVISTSIFKYDYSVSDLKTQAKEAASINNLNYDELIEVL